jgi:CHRD domain
VRRLLILAASLTLTGGLASFAASAHAAPASTEQSLDSSASGAQVRSAPGDADATGTGTFRVDPATHQFCYKVAADHLTLPATAMRIAQMSLTDTHSTDQFQQFADQSPIVEVAPSREVVVLDPAKLNAADETCVEVANSYDQRIATHPEEFFWTVDTSDFPKGAIRGQLKVAGTAATISANGDGFQVPGKGDPDGLLSASLTADHGLQDSGELRFSALEVSGTSSPVTAFQLRRGAVGQTGRVVTTLRDETAAGQRVPRVAAGTPFFQSVDRDVLTEIHDHPERFYLQANTADFPEGAVRGQLVLAGRIPFLPDDAKPGDTLEPNASTTTPDVATSGQEGKQVGTSTEDSGGIGAPVIVGGILGLGLVAAGVAALVLRRRPA